MICKRYWWKRSHSLDFIIHDLFDRMCTPRKVTVKSAHRLIILTMVTCRFAQNYISHLLYSYFTIGHFYDTKGLVLHVQSLKDPVSMTWEPDRMYTCRSNFFSTAAHLCAVTYIIEVSLILALGKQFTSQKGPCDTFVRSVIEEELYSLSKSVIALFTQYPVSGSSLPVQFL